MSMLNLSWIDRHNRVDECELAALNPELEVRDIVGNTRLRIPAGPSKPDGASEHAYHETCG